MTAAPPGRLAALASAALPGRLAALASAVALIVAVSPATSAAMTPPVVDPAFVPADGPPGPEQAMRQTAPCRTAVITAQPDIALPAPSFTMLNVSRAWQYSTGHGVRVAVIDSGVNPSPRLPVIAGGDYVESGGQAGLSDCDLHGTLVASVIAAAPQGGSMPAPMPKTPYRGSHSEPAEPTTQPRPTAPATVSAEPRPAAQDGLAGVAPHATVISIRQSSVLFAPANPRSDGAAVHEKAGTVATLARAIVHAANLGAAVINVSVTACVSAADPLDQRALGAAVWYAATVKDSVVVAAAGNEGDDGCAQNPLQEPPTGTDSRDWQHVATVSAPSVYTDYVLSVGAVDTTGAPIDASLAGPWVGVAAPGVGIIGLAGPNGGAVNAYAPVRPGEPSVPFSGTSFSAAYVSGVAALIRAKFPELSAHQVIQRIQQTAHNPPRGVDNQVGYGVVDPVAALTFNVRPGEPSAPGAGTRVVSPPAAPPPPDHRARTIALGFAATAALAGLFGSAMARARRAR